MQRVLARELVNRLAYTFHVIDAMRISKNGLISAFQIKLDRDLQELRIRRIFGILRVRVRSGNRPDCRQGSEKTQYSVQYHPLQKPKLLS